MTALTSYLHILLSKACLSQQEAEEAMDAILSDANPYQVAAFLSILKFRGEHPEEVVGMVKALRKKSVQVKFPFPVIDIVGTGGDMQNTVNISTGAAILTAACGLPVAKHGNRSASGRTGSADVLEALGVHIETPPEFLQQHLQETGIAFMFAPCYHPSLRSIAPIRRALKLPTIFNILGPLLNPANAEYALIGVPNDDLLELISTVVMHLGTTKRTLVFNGSGLDELTPIGPAKGYDIHEGKKTAITLDPQHYGFSPCSIKDLQGGDAATNAHILEMTFKGQPGPIADALTFNAGAALCLFGATDNFAEGISLAKSRLSEGKAMEVLEKFKSISQRSAKS